MYCRFQPVLFTLKKSNEELLNLRSDVIWSPYREPIIT